MQVKLFFFIYFCICATVSPLAWRKDAASCFCKPTCADKSIHTEWQQEALPEHPWAGVSSESWTSSESPALPGWRPRPRPPGCMVWPPRTERSGHWGCWGTAPLREKHRRSSLIQKKNQGLQEARVAHLLADWPKSPEFSHSSHPPPPTTTPPPPLHLFRGCLAPVLFELLHPKPLFSTSE